MGEALRPTRTQLLDLAKSSALKLSVAEAALGKVERAIDAFSATAKQVGVSGTTTRKVQRRLDEVRRDYEKVKAAGVINTSSGRPKTSRVPRRSKAQPR
jgi:hypothetical protein